MNVKKFGECNTPKFKVGDKVRVLPRNSDIFYSPEYVNDMTQYAGQIYTISEINGTSDSITLEQIPYFWDSKALELVNEKEKSKATGSPNTSMNIDKQETQFEAELNLFPTKKHYQLNFNY